MTHDMAQFLFWAGILVCVLAIYMGINNIIDDNWGMVFIDGIAFMCAAMCSWVNYGIMNSWQ